MRERERHYHYLGSIASVSSEFENEDGLRAEEVWETFSFH